MFGLGTSHLLSGWAGWTPDMSQLPELPREVARIIKEKRHGHTKTVKTWMSTCQKDDDKTHIKHISSILKIPK